MSCVGEWILTIFMVLDPQRTGRGRGRNFQNRPFRKFFNVDRLGNIWGRCFYLFYLRDFIPDEAGQGVKIFKKLENSRRLIQVIINDNNTFFVNVIKEYLLLQVYL